MRKGERRKVVTRCTACRRKRIITKRTGEPMSPEEVAELLNVYVCSDCDGTR